AFAGEVTRVAREVGTEGKLGGQAQVSGVAGTWKDLTDNVNFMASNLTGQVRNIADVATAIARGDLSRKITVDVKGEILQLKDTINTMVDQLNAFASEVTRVAREVGTEGKLGGQADVRGVGGVWKDLTDSVNSMASNLTSQVRNIAEVTTAVATGDLSRKITVDVRGEILELKNTINTMVDQLNAFANEVTRVAREVGTEGKLGGQADVKGVAGVWEDLTVSVNSMASNLTNQVRNIAEVTTAVANGDLSRKITVDVRGEILELKNTINTMVDQLSSFASEVTRVAREVGTEGKLGGQADVRGVAGTWKDLTDSVNSMARNLTNQVRNIAQVTTAVANGDLSRKITVDVQGEILELKNTINTMVDQLNSFASEVTRVAREVGTEGKLGGQAMVRGVAGVWKELTDSVNQMAGNLTTQVRGIAKVVTAVANGDLKRKLVLETKGEIAALADTINSMIDTLATFADQVTTVAREVGVEGKLGGQARVPGAAGIWRDLTNNVNQLTATLTTQVRAIADVATAVTKGDLTRSISVEAQGEVATLKDTINQMIVNLRETTLKNTEQDWLKTNVARFTRMLQGQRDLLAVSKLILSELAPLVSAQQGVFYINSTDDNAQPVLKLIASYAYKERRTVSMQWSYGEGLVGQCALEKERILVTGAPADYIRISSGLGEAAPLNIVVLPVLFEGQVKAVIELASFNRFSEIHLQFLDQLVESMGIVLNTIEATMRTEELLKQSQALTEELQSRQEELTEGNRRLEHQARELQESEELLRMQQEELQRTNAELQDKARLLAEQKSEVERKNLEVEQAKRALEEKAEQLALISKYKSEFLANMSHELRTPLNSLLILAKVLAENSDGKLSPKQVKFAETIYGAGTDLLALINDILDLSKIESGMMVLEQDELQLIDLRDYVLRTFRHVAEGKGLAFNVEIGEDVPRTMITDSKRLQQVIKNLLANALKFTDHGSVSLRIRRALSGWSSEKQALNQARNVIAFDVVDTGIGIPSDKQNVIFEAFRQADGTTSRRYGGTGLGLSISREIARLLGGEIRLQSAPAVGSTFTLFLPQAYAGPAVNRPDLRPSPAEAVTPIPSEAVLLGDIEPPLLARADVIDDRGQLQPDDKVLLVIEDDAAFAPVLMDLAHKRGFKVVLANRGDKGLALARELKPNAITLDIHLPDMAGWLVLHQLKYDPETRHIPIHIISVDDDLRRGLALGADSYLEKTVDEEALVATFDKIQTSMHPLLRQLLLIESEQERAREIMEVAGGPDVQFTLVTGGEEALERIEHSEFDCVVTSSTVGDLGIAPFLEKIRKRRHLPELPIVVYAPGELSPGEESALRCAAEEGVLKRVRSLARVLEETTIFLNRREQDLTDKQRALLERLRRQDTMLAGSAVLIIDDDVRNIFALTSGLERHHIKVLHAEGGRAGMELLKQHPEIDLVLLDIMMPEMDGYETSHAIRQMPQFRGLPIIALTAKAMKGDREKCIEAGASDYIPKPVVLEELIAMLRVWLPQTRGDRIEFAEAVNASEQ
ncbi:MAG: HAMP domain-containing protein, partial [Acidobacteria bacterium]|nr:HAMP domain-containing protein [Acidobacteriota bacterium]